MSPSAGEMKFIFKKKKKKKTLQQMNPPKGTLIFQRSNLWEDIIPHRKEALSSSEALITCLSLSAQTLGRFRRQSRSESSLFGVGLSPYIKSLKESYNISKYSSLLY